MFFSILVPILLGCTISCKIDESISWRIILDILTSAFLPIKLQCELAAAKFTRKRILDLSDVSMSPWFQEVVDNIANLEETIVKHNRLQMGLETIFQFTGNIILIFYSLSETKTRQGLAALFQEDGIVIFGKNIPPNVMIAFLLATNSASFIKGNLNGIMAGHGSNYSPIALSLLLLSIGCASTVRIISMILYFAPGLGLFNLLHHYQGSFNVLSLVTLCILNLFCIFLVKLLSGPKAGLG